MPMTRPAASALSDAMSRPTVSPHPRMSGATVRAAKKPRTTVGMPARISRIGLHDGRTLGRRILRQIDRREQTHGTGDQNGDRRDQQRAGEQRNEAVGGRDLALVGAHRGLRVPFGAEQEVENARLARDGRIEEEPVGLADDREHDADGRQNRYGRAHDENHINDAFESIARPEIHRYAAEGVEQPGQTQQDARTHKQLVAEAARAGVGGRGCLQDFGNLTRVLAGGRIHDIAHGSAALQRIGRNLISEVRQRAMLCQPLHQRRADRRRREAWGSGQARQRTAHDMWATNAFWRSCRPRRSRPGCGLPGSQRSRGSRSLTNTGRPFPLSRLLLSTILPGGPQGQHGSRSRSRRYASLRGS